MTKLDFNKEYYFLNEGDGESTLTGVGFIKLLRLVGDERVHYKMSDRYQDLFLEHPKYKDEIELEPYTEELKEFRKWHKDNNTSLCYSDINFLEKGLHEIKDIDSFPMKIKVNNNYIAVIPGSIETWREWQIYKLLND